MARVRAIFSSATSAGKCTAFNEAFRQGTHGFTGAANNTLTQGLMTEVAREYLAQKAETFAKSLNKGDTMSEATAKTFKTEKALLATASDFIAETYNSSKLGTMMNDARQNSVKDVDFTSSRSKRM